MIFELGGNLNSLSGYRKNAPSDGEKVIHFLHGGTKIPRNFSGCKKYEITEIMTRKFPSVKSKVKDVVQVIIVLCQGHNAVPDIPGREHTPFLPEPSGAPSFIAYGYYCRNVSGIAFKSSQKSGKSGSSSKSDYMRPHGKAKMLGVTNFLLSFPQERSHPPASSLKIESEKDCASEKPRKNTEKKIAPWATHEYSSLSISL
jgi:hypothetical protein